MYVIDRERTHVQILINTIIAVFTPQWLILLQDERDGLRAAAAMASQGDTLSEARLLDREQLVDSLQVIGRVIPSNGRLSSLIVTTGL